MSDDTDDDEALTFADMMEFGVENVEREVENFDGEMPDHAAKLIVSNAADLLQTVTNLEMEASHNGKDELSDEERKEPVEDDVVDILLAIAALKYERGLDIEGAFEDRIELVTSYLKMQEMLEDAETQEEAVRAIEEHMDEHAPDDADIPMDGIGGPSIEPGDNVDSDDYDPDDDRDRHIA